jgi:hypothetical protein
MSFHDDLDNKEYPSWENTLSQRTINHKETRIWHIQNLAEVAADLGYPYICWNDRIYEVSRPEGKPFSFAWEDTGLKFNDVL